MADQPGALSSARRQMPSTRIERHPVEFTGRGGEYFRVWIVNVLLTIVTLSLYTPWARRRTAQYFYSHTHVAGSPLEFVAELRRMVFGFLVYFALYVAYELASYTEQELATTLLAISFAVLTPFIWGSAMRFRYRATRWRGIRLAFVASWKEVYLASWPVFVIAAMWAGFFVTVEELAPDHLEPGALFRGGWSEAWPFIAAFGLCLVVTLLCIIRLDFNYTRLRISRMRMGGMTGRWKLGYGNFVKIWLAAIGIFLLTLLGFIIVLVVSVGGTTYMTQGTAGLAKSVGWLLLGVLVFFAVVIGSVVASLPARAWREARLFQLVWNNVGFGQIARTRTSLRTGAYVWLRVKNVLLSFLTIGFYRPFAIASEYAAKVGSVTLYVKGGGIEQLEGEVVQQQGAFGDAAADAFGLDVIG